MHSTAWNSLAVFCVSRRVVAICHKCSVTTKSVHLPNLAKYTWLKKCRRQFRRNTQRQQCLVKETIYARGEKFRTAGFRAEQNSGLLQLCSVPSDTILQWMKRRKRNIRWNNDGKCHVSMTALDGVFGQWLITRGPPPHRSTNNKASNYYVFATVKNFVWTINILYNSINSKLDATIIISLIISISSTCFGR